MCGYLQKFVATHKYFVEAVAGVLLCKKGLQPQDYTNMIVVPQTPIDKISIVLLAHKYKIHLCIFLQGKYFTTNHDEALNKATMYLVYVGKNTLFDTTRKGSIHWSVMEVPQSNYDLCKPKSNEVVENPSPAPKSGHKTLNSLQAGLMDEN